MTSPYSLRRRFSDAACAFQTGHSVRDLERVTRRRLVLLATRAADTIDREAAAEPSDYAASSLRSWSARLREAVESYLKCLNREREATLLCRLDIRRIEMARRRWEETADFEAVDRFDDGTSAGRDALWFLPGEFAAKLHKGLFEDPGFYLGLYEQRIGVWNWHRFLRWVRQGCKAGAVRVLRAGVPP